MMAKIRLTPARRRGLEVLARNRRVVESNRTDPAGRLYWQTAQMFAEAGLICPDPIVDPTMRVWILTDTGRALCHELGIEATDA